MGLFLVLHLLSLKRYQAMSFQVCQVDNLPFWVFHGSPDHVYSLLSVDLKQIDCQIFLQQRWVYSGSAENCSSSFATRVTPCASPQRARDVEHFYKGKRKLRGLFIKESMAFHWLNPCQKRKGIFLPVECCYCCNLIYQSYKRLSIGIHMGLLKSTVVVTAALCLVGFCPVQSITDPLSIPGRCSLQVFTPLSRGQY